ncbi:MAG: ATP-binding protein involved in chromosome partitioning, partial [Frankiaceae bacterium]|nr:ATP-binding protein involved in chromosome partitioning [Frankiaceae bacterium]
GSVPIDVRLREGGDAGVPLVMSDPDAPAAKELRSVAERLVKPLGLVGRPLGLSVV